MAISYKIPLKVSSRVDTSCIYVSVRLLRVNIQTNSMYARDMGCEIVILIQGTVSLKPLGSKAPKLVLFVLEKELLSLSDKVFRPS